MEEIDPILINKLHLDKISGSLATNAIRIRPA
jgi:hypothetical protein